MDLVIRNARIFGKPPVDIGIAAGRIVAIEAGLAADAPTHTDRSARLMNLCDYGIAVGNPADIVIFDATTPEEAIAEVRGPLVAFKNGVRTVTRPRAELHKP